MGSLERALGRVEWETEERVDLSDILSVTFETESTIALHIEEKAGSFSEKLASLNEGLKLLAHQLQHDAGYARVENIFAYSAIVTLHPDVLRRYGFEVDNEYDSPVLRGIKRKYDAAEETDPVPGKYSKVEPSLARISKAAFLQRYGS